MLGYAVIKEKNMNFICEEIDCWYNVSGYCYSVSDLWNHDLGKDCPDYDQV